MVRVGGGWQELGSFLKDHSELETSLPNVRSFMTLSDEDGVFAHGTGEGSGMVGAMSGVVSSEGVAAGSSFRDNRYSLSFHRAIKSFKK
ncbi:hypothetical protein BC829DRAFT_397693 [Chytridium lagenaria]|nr:hypothetical protein BC829DRAFT_397693 [Chytridium lagenaria]